MTQANHLSDLSTLIGQALRLPNVLADLSAVPPGSGDEAEAEALLATLKALHVHRDGTNSDPALEPAGVLEGALQAAAQPAAETFRRAVHSILGRLDRLARQGVPLPGCVRAADFGRVVPLETDDPTRVWVAGVYDSLPEGHPLRARLKREDCYDEYGEALVNLGLTIPGEAGAKPLPWLPIEVAVRLTLFLSTPQKASRQARRDQEEAEKEARRQAEEDGKGRYIRRLEAQLAEARQEIAGLKAAPVG